MTEDKEAERILISLATNNKNVADIVGYIDKDDFTDIENKNMFELISNMFTNSEEVSLLSIDTKNHSYLRSFMFKNSFSKMSEIDMIAVESDIPLMIKRIKSAAKNRKLLNIALKIQDNIKENIDADDIITRVQNEIIGVDTVNEHKLLSPKDIAIACTDAAAERMDKEKLHEDVIYTSYKTFNEITGGLEKGDLVILSGVTGGGKSALALNLANQIGTIQKRSTLYINTEMSDKQIGLRLDAHIGGISHTNLRNGNITQEQFARLIGKLDRVSNGKLYMQTIPDLKIQSCISEMIKYKKQKGIEVVIIDYIGRTDSLDMNKDDWKILKAAAQKLKTMAQDLNMVVIMLAQLSKSGDLAQASYMAHEADLWINIKRLEYQDELAKFYPYNSLLELRKARSADKSRPIGMLFVGDRMTFISDRAEAERIQKINEQARQSANN